MTQGKARGVDTIKDSLQSAGYTETAKYYKGIVGLASKLSAKYNNNLDKEDFIQIALLTATHLEKTEWDAAKGNTFYTFVSKPIKQAIQLQYGNKQSKTLKFKKISSFIRTFEKDTKKYPTVPEIAAGTKLKEWEIVSIYYDKHRDVQLSSLESRPDYEEMTSITPDNSINIFEYVNKLDSLSQSVIELHFVDELKFSDIGAHLGISSTTVGKILEDALSELQEMI